jgi:hypothetical protein
MIELKKNAFKPNIIESNPEAFGLRTKEIINSVEALLNYQSIFITGSRGIGKSSLGSQLQKVLKGDNTLLDRCFIKANSSNFLCIFYACGRETTIEELTLDILYSLEKQLLSLPKLALHKLKPTIELNFGVFKAKFEAEVEAKKISPSSIANKFIDTIKAVYEKAIEFEIFSGINIMIDEVDQLSPSINFGHFVKIIHETLSNLECTKVTFVFAGQLGSYTRFNKEDPSFERIVKCIPLDKLSWEATDYILTYAASKCRPVFSFKEDARQLLLSLASGYPYLVHLLGDGCFRELSSSCYVDKQTVLTSLQNIILSDKREKFTQKLKDLTHLERKLLFNLSAIPPMSLPAEMPYELILDLNIKGAEKNNKLSEILDSLELKDILYSKREKTVFYFSEELFRIFISYLRIEMSYSKTMQRKAEIENKEDLVDKRNEEDKEIQRFIAEGIIDSTLIDSLSIKER